MPSSSITIGLASSDTTEASLAAVYHQIIFTAETWATPQTVTMTGVDDPVEDGDVSFSVVMAAPISSDTNFAALSGTAISAATEDGRVLFAANFNLVTDSRVLCVCFQTTVRECLLSQSVGYGVQRMAARTSLR
jgi:hypothetical protein